MLIRASFLRAWKTKIEIQGYEDSQELKCQTSQNTEVPRNQTELSVVLRWYRNKNSSSGFAKEGRSPVKTQGFQLGHLKVCVLAVRSKWKQAKAQKRRKSSPEITPVWLDKGDMSCSIWQKFKRYLDPIQFLICNVWHSNN